MGKRGRDQDASGILMEATERDEGKSGVVSKRHGGPVDSVGQNGRLLSHSILV